MLELIEVEHIDLTIKHNNEVEVIIPVLIFFDYIDLVVCFLAVISKHVGKERDYIQPVKDYFYNQEAGIMVDFNIKVERRTLIPVVFFNQHKVRKNFTFKRVVD